MEQNTLSEKTVGTVGMLWQLSQGWFYGNNAQQLTCEEGKEAVRKQSLELQRTRSIDSKPRENKVQRRGTRMGWNFLKITPKNSTGISEKGYKGLALK